MPYSSNSIDDLIAKASQLLSDAHGKDLEELQRILESLKEQKASQLADLVEVENQVQALLQGIENKKQQEQDEAIRRKEAEEFQQGSASAYLSKVLNNNASHSLKTPDLVEVENQVQALLQGIENKKRQEQDEAIRRKEAEKLEQARKHNRRNKRGIVLAAVFLGLIIAASLGVYFKYPSVKLNITPRANQIVSHTLPPSPTPILSTCDLSITNPSAAADITNYGPVTFQWTSVPAAINYSVQISPPQGWIVFEKGTSKTIYMENLPEGGEHQVEVDALDQDGKVLCTAVLKFNKKAYILSDNKKQKQEQGQGQAEPQPTPTPWTFQSDLP